MHPRAHLLTTKRTVLTPFDDDDADQLLAMYREPEVRGYLLDNVLVSPAWVQKEIDASQQRFARHGAGLWAVHRREAAGIIGFVGFREFFHPPELQLLYGFLPAFWGQGYAGEVTARVCERVFRDLDFDEITSATDVPNRGSSRVLERLGMQLVKTTNDGVAGTRLYALSRERWNASAGAQDA